MVFFFESVDADEKKNHRRRYAGALQRHVKTIIGRHPSVSEDRCIVVDATYVSRKHAVVYLDEDDQPRLVNMGKFGTKVNGVFLSMNQDVGLKADDVVTVGGLHGTQGVDFTLTQVRISLALSSKLTKPEREQVQHQAGVYGMEIAPFSEAHTTHLVIPKTKWKLTETIIRALLNETYIVSPDWVAAFSSSSSSCTAFPPDPLLFLPHVASVPSEPVVAGKSSIPSFSPSAIIAPAGITQACLGADFEPRSSRKLLFRGYYFVYARKETEALHVCIATLQKAGAEQCIEIEEWRSNVRDLRFVVGVFSEEKKLVQSAFPNIAHVVSAEDIFMYILRAWHHFDQGQEEIHADDTWQEEEHGKRENRNVENIVVNIHDDVVNHSENEKHMNNNDDKHEEEKAIAESKNCEVTCKTEGEWLESIPLRVVEEEEDQHARKRPVIDHEELQVVDHHPRRNHKKFRKNAVICHSHETTPIVKDEIEVAVRSRAAAPGSLALDEEGERILQAFGVKQAS